MAFKKILGGALANHLIGANVWAGDVTLTSGSATVDVSADLTDGRELENAPYVVALPQVAGEGGIAATTASTSTVTLDDGTGSTTGDVFVVIVEPVGSQP